MDRLNQKNQENMQSSDEEREKIAVPYTPPPPPDSLDQKKFRSPLVNGFLIAFFILLGGFMLYNFVGHQLTLLSSESSGQPFSSTISPTITPTPTPNN